MRGNIINEETLFNITGKLVTAIDIPNEEVFCNDMMFYLHVPIRMESIAAEIS